MHRYELDTLLGEVLAGRRLLTHPFYRRWEAGTLAPEELAAYAGQYRHFEAALPEVLETSIQRIEDARARALVEANFADETGSPAPHIELFDQFVACVGGRPDEDAGTAMTELVFGYRALAASDAAGALAALAAYEIQGREIATSKARGLRERYGLDTSGTLFWDVHGSMESMHSDWTIEALAASSDDADAICAAAQWAADSWWSFLDEREELAPSPATY